MSNGDALVSVAMLAAFKELKNKDYIDLLKPFVLYLLPQGRGAHISIDSIHNSLKNQYGFSDIPYNVVKYIITTRLKKEDYVIKNNKQYYVNKVYDNNLFKHNHEVIKNSIEEVLDALIEFVKLNKRKHDRNLNKKSAATMLQNFLSDYGYKITKNFDQLHSVTNENNNYLVAKFIIDAKETNDKRFRQIMNVVIGYFVYSAIYYCDVSKNISPKSKLKKTEVYLDTMLLIFVLGYNTEYQKIATRELISLTYDMGGCVKTFKHNVDETIGILTKFAKDKKARNQMDLEYLVNENYTKDDIERLISSLQNNLTREKIQIVDKMEYGIVSSNDDESLENKGYLDIAKFDSILKELYKNNNKNPSEKTMNNDIDSISTISRIRKSSEFCGIETCKAIFVTPNTIIIKALNQLFTDDNLNGIGLAITDIQLTSLLWLKSGERYQELPSLQLIENAFSALQPSDEVLTTFNNKLSKLEKEGNIDSETVFVMRSQLSVKEDLVEFTENDVDNLDDSTVLEIIENYNKRIYNSKIEKLSKDIKNEKEKNLKIYSKIKQETDEEARRKTNNRFFTYNAIIIIIFIIVGVLAAKITYMQNQNSFFAFIFTTIFFIISLCIYFFGIRKIISKRKEKYFNELFNKIYSMKLKYYEINDI